MLANDPSRNRPGLLVWAALALIVFSASGITVAQQGAWEPVPADELALKDEPKAPGASAIILFRSLAIDDKRGTLTESTRIKVLTDAGKKYADIAIPTAKWMKVEEVEARTVGRDGSSVPFSGTIHDVTVAKTRKYAVEMKSLTLPDVGPGTIIEYRYRMHWKAEDLPSHTWDIQSELFTRRAHFELASKPGSPIHWVARNWQQGPPQSNGTLFTLEVFNVLALEKEDHTLPESELRAAVDFFYTYPPYDTQESFWSRYAEYYGVELDKFIGNDKRVQQLVASVASPADPPETRLRKLYTRAQQVRKISIYDFDTEEARRERLHESKHVSDVIEHNYGTTFDITALLIAMARDVGYRSGLVFVVDRERGLFHPDILSSRQLTATLLWVEKDGTFRILDPACQKCPFGLISWDQSGASGIRTSYPGSVFVKIPVNVPEDAVLERTGNLKLDTDGGLSGDIRVSLAGLYALELRNKEEKTDETSRKEAIVDRIKSWLPNSAEVALQQLKNWNDIDQPIVADVSISISGFASVTSKRIVVPAWPFGVVESDPFPHDQRKYAVVFENQYQRKDTLIVAIPVGYQVESMPMGMRTADAVLDFTFKPENKGSTIQLTRQFTNHAIYVDTKYYKQLQFDYHEVKTADEQRATLRQSVSASQ